MKFISFNAMTNKGLDKKVNNFLSDHSDIEVIDIKYAASVGNIYAAILYR